MNILAFFCVLFLRYMEQGFPNLPLSFLLTVTSLPTTVVGARLVHTINPNLLRKITGIDFIKMLFSSLRRDDDVLCTSNLFQAQQNYLH